MIRINLLPVKLERKREAGQKQLVLFGLILVLALVGLYFLGEMVSSRVERHRRDVQVLEKKVRELKESLVERDRYIAKRNELLEQKKVFKELFSRRTGPVKMLNELSMILSPTRGPGVGWTIGKEEYDDAIRKNPNVVVNLSWDPTRVWLEDLEEKNGEITVKGMAKSNEDVAELSKRMSLSPYFVGVRIGLTEDEVDRDTRIRFVKFAIYTTVNYSPERPAAAAAPTEGPPVEEPGKPKDSPFKPKTPDKITEGA